MSTPAEKGDALERAVRAIEETILRSFPGYSESAFRIEGKKILVVSGVHHEIDLYVTVSLGPGYDAIFIFECKNWQEKIGKNEIIVFAEKVKVANAQRGFFVAKSYTADAIAQAQGDPRLELLLASELDPSAVMVPLGFHLLEIQETKANFTVEAKKTSTEAPGSFPLNDIDVALFSLGGTVANLKEYIDAWAVKARDTRLSRFNSVTAGPGVHQVEFEEERTFEDHDAASLDGRSVRGIKLRGTVQVEIRKAVVMSVFEVATRGRFVSVRVDSPAAKITANFVELGKNPPDVMARLTAVIHADKKK
jgi:hypothetical protein